MAAIRISYHKKVNTPLILIYIFDKCVLFKGPIEMIGCRYGLVEPVLHRCQLFSNFYSTFKVNNVWRNFESMGDRAELWHPIYMLALLASSLWWHWPKYRIKDCGSIVDCHIEML